MVKKVNEVPPEQLKRDKGAKRETEMAMAARIVSETIARDLDAQRGQMQTAVLEQLRTDMKEYIKNEILTKPWDMCENAQVAEHSESTKLTVSTILLWVLVLSLLGWTAFQRLYVPPQLPTKAEVTIQSHAVDTQVGGSSSTPSVPERLSTEAPRAAHSLRISLTKPCWIQITEQTPAAKVLLDGANQPAAYQWEDGFAEAATVEVRSGCPGDVYYVVNGVPAHPDNASGKPDKSEIVDLAL
jgi:hypothetical protein